MNKPPGDDLPAGVTSLDPTGGPQGPYFETSFQSMGHHEPLITWKQLCEYNPHVWIDDEKRVDFIDMFGSLNSNINQKQLGDYVHRISNDTHVESKYSKRSSFSERESFVNSVETHEHPYTHHIFPHVFDDELVQQIKQLYDTDLFNESDEKDNKYRCVYTAKKTDYGVSNTITRVVDTLINKQTVHFYNKMFNHVDIDLSAPDTLHAVYFGINYTGYQTPPHIDNNKLLTMLIYFPEDSTEDLGTEILDNNKQFIKRSPYDTNVGYMFSCHHNTGPTYHSFTKHIPTRRCTVMYNVFRNEQDYITSYDTGGPRDMIMRSRLKREVPTHLFRSDELLHYRFDWNDPRVVNHRKQMPYGVRFDKQQGGINYRSMPHSIIKELLIDNKLDDTGDYFQGVKRLIAHRAHMTALAEKTWDPTNPEKYLQPQGSG